jgi:predicted CoA-binding protein/CBS domain-containing protein
MGADENIARFPVAALRRHRRREREGLVRDRMRRGIVRVCATDSTGDTLKVMEGHNVDHALVYEGCRLVGLVVRADLSAATLFDPGGAETPLVRVMQRGVVTVTPGTTLSEAATLMLDRRLDALPVATNTGEVVGLISDRDLLEAAAGRPAPERVRRRSLASPLHATLKRCHTVAVVGLDTRDASGHNLAAARLMTLGFTVYPVHPSVSAMLGVRAYPDLTAIPDAIHVVHVFASDDVDLDRLASAAIAKQAHVFWYEGRRLPARIVERLRAGGLEVVVDRSLESECLRLAGR